MKHCGFHSQRDNQCTGEVVDELEIPICSKHLGRVVELLTNHGFKLIAPAKKLATTS
jgi:hypothetical protein